MNSIRRAATSSDNWELRGEVTASLTEGAELAKKHCKQQFKWDKWNCPDSAFTNKQKFGLTREQAYVSAMISAAIVYSVARDCSRGELTACECSPRKGESEAQWLWEGCEDVSLGEKVSQSFLAAMEGSSVDLLTQTNFHNYRLGRLVVREERREECKCHGVSGSCSTKTCWQRVAPFSQVGTALKHKYDRALRVDFNLPRLGLDLPHHQLVFLADSPNYCRRNNTTGWEGTAGRVCSRARGTGVSRTERRSCKELCRSCGHQVHSRPKTHTWNCNCIFQWCCQVVCDKCTRIIHEYYCNATPHQI